MVRIAQWLLAARMRQTLAIALLLALPGVKLAASMVAVASVLSHGPMAALPLLLGGFGIAGVIGLAAPLPGYATMVLVQGGVALAAALVIGLLLRKTESLTLTLQVLTILAVAGTGLFYIQVADPGAYWATLVADWVANMQQSGVAVGGLTTDESADAIAVVAQLMTGVLAGFNWYAAALIALGGYFLWDVGQDESQARFGRFRELNLGRALAILLVIFALAASLSKSMAMINIAVLMLMVFGLHGIALLHWLRFRYQWPLAVMVVAYGLMLIPTALAGYITILVCVAGYVDAWFNMVRAGPKGEAR